MKGCDQRIMNASDRKNKTFQILGPTMASLSTGVQRRKRIVFSCGEQMARCKCSELYLTLYKA